MPDAGVPSSVRVVLFTDVVGSTDLKSRLGTHAYLPRLQRHNDLFTQSCARFRGRVVKHTGDGFLALFDAASDAVRAALVFQRAMRDEPWTPEPLQTRVGIHSGELAEMEMGGQKDVTGLAADLAARVMSLAQGGQVLLTRWPFNDARQFVPEHPAAGRVTRVVFSPEGTRVATASADKTARVWDVCEDARPLNDLRALAELIADARLDELGGHHDLSDSEWTGSVGLAPGEIPRPVPPPALPATAPATDAVGRTRSAGLVPLPTAAQRLFQLMGSAWAASGLRVGW